MQCPSDRSLIIRLALYSGGEESGVVAPGLMFDISDCYEKGFLLSNTIY